MAAPASRARRRGPTRRVGRLARGAAWAPSTSGRARTWLRPQPTTFAAALAVWFGRARPGRAHRGRVSRDASATTGRRPRRGNDGYLLDAVGWRRRGQTRVRRLGARGERERESIRRPKTSADAGDVWGGEPCTTERAVLSHRGDGLSKQRYDCLDGAAPRAPRRRRSPQPPAWRRRRLRGPCSGIESAVALGPSPPGPPCSAAAGRRCRLSSTPPTPAASPSAAKGA